MASEVAEAVPEAVCEASNASAGRPGRSTGAPPSREALRHAARGGGRPAAEASGRADEGDAKRRHRRKRGTEDPAPGRREGPGRQGGRHAQRSRPADGRSRSEPPHGGGERRLKQLLEEVASHLDVAMGDAQPTDADGWLQETAQLELFVEELSWLLSECREQPRLRTGGSREAEPIQRREFAVFKGDKDLRWARQQVKHYEREHAHAASLLANSDGNQQMDEIRQVERDIEKEKGRQKQLVSENRQRERSLARIAKDAEVGERDQDGNSRALQQIQRLETELGVWKVKNSSLEQQIEQASEQLKKAHVGRQAMDLKAQQLAEELESEEHQVRLAELKAQEERVEAEEAALKESVAELQEARTRAAKAHERQHKEKARELNDVKQEKAELEQRLRHVEADEAQIRRQLRAIAAKVRDDSRHETPTLRAEPATGSSARRLAEASGASPRTQLARPTQICGDGGDAGHEGRAEAGQGLDDGSAEQTPRSMVRDESFATAADDERSRDGERLATQTSRGSSCCSSPARSERGPELDGRSGRSASLSREAASGSSGPSEAGTLAEAERFRLASALHVASCSDRLASALTSQFPRPEAGGLGDRSRAAQLLGSACLDGRLQEALAEGPPPGDRPLLAGGAEARVAEVARRTRLAARLHAASRSGRLAEVLASETPEPSRRECAQRALGSAFLDGRLQQSLAEVSKPSQREPSTPPMPQVSGASRGPRPQWTFAEDRSAPVPRQRAPVGAPPRGAPAGVRVPSASPAPRLGRATSVGRAEERPHPRRARSPGVVPARAEARRVSPSPAPRRAAA